MNAAMGKAVIIDGRFAVRVIPAGAKYGRNNSRTADQALIEFYDTRQPGLDALGQFVTSDTARSLADARKQWQLRVNAAGLDLEIFDPIPQWPPTEAGMRTVRALARAVVGAALPALPMGVE